MEKFLNKYFTEKEKIILACSAWPDSMYICYKILETNYKKNLILCYFNHNLRKEAKDEEKFLLNLWKKFDIKIEIWNENIKKLQKESKKSISIEELARKERYKFFHKILKKYNSNKIILAHHLDDKIETFMFNLIRWTKITWLINMIECKEVVFPFKYKILRPILNLQKKEILSFLEKDNLDYKIDKTNFLNDFSRNKLRNQIMPKIENINSNYRKNIQNFINYLTEIDKLINLEVKNFFQII